jgi:hypothetical protein
LFYLSLLSLSTGERGCFGDKLRVLGWNGTLGLDGLSKTSLSYLSPQEREDALEIN